MTWTAPEVTRTSAPTEGGERELLQGWLDRHRRTLLWKCAGLDAAALRRRAVPPSRMSLLGLVRHMSEVERGWFRLAAAETDLDYLYCSEANPSGDFEDIDDADPRTAFATYHAEVAAADAAMAPLPLDHTFVFPRGGTGTRYTVRWVYLHMIEEYARHNGHADLLRERIDGRTGD
ncbi:DinB family protein [Nocardia farcinica]|uniref:DinB family protein n=1 Tax=Nocardia farcinica TaxID=37329 RepID=UPI0018934F62|nr:DinB family protein [Nocardia farcinica]MBF6520019.1 DinB family protein [Nocardia farcinica]